MMEILRWAIEALSEWKPKARSGLLNEERSSWKRMLP